MSVAGQTVVDAAQKAVALMEKYSEYDPHDSTDESNPWNDPDRLLASLDEARNNVVAAQQQLLQQQSSKRATPPKNGDQEKELDESAVRAVYLDMITDSFADVLENLREQHGERLDLDLLVDCLQSGLDLLHDDEKQYLMLDHASDDMQDSESDSDLTPHERRQRERGLSVEAAH